VIGHGQTHPWVVPLRTTSPKFKNVNLVEFNWRNLTFLNCDFYYWFAPHGLYVPHLCIHHEKIVNIYIAYANKCVVFFTCVLEIPNPLSLSVKLHHHNFFLKGLPTIVPKIPIPLYHQVSSCTVVKVFFWVYQLLSQKYGLNCWLKQTKW